MRVIGLGGIFTVSYLLRKSRVKIFRRRKHGDSRFVPKYLNVPVSSYRFSNPFSARGKTSGFVRFLVIYDSS